MPNGYEEDTPDASRTQRAGGTPNYILYDKLVEIDKKVDRIDQRVTEVVLARLEQLERRVNNHERTLERINVKVYGFMAGAGLAVASITKAVGAW